MTAMAAGRFKAQSRLSVLLSFCLLGGTGLGTAWVLSMQHRLLATNVHAADMMHQGGGSMIAIVNNTDQVFTIDQVWYHPGVLQQVSVGFSVRQSDLAAGSVYPLSPDVAVLHVTGEAELPNELQMATTDEVDDYCAQPVSMLGFPGHDTSRWPAMGEKPVAPLRERLICRLHIFALNAFNSYVWTNPPNRSFVMKEKNGPVDLASYPQ